MSHHLIVHQHEGGFFSNFNKVITFLESHPEISKITWNLQGQPFGAFAYDCGEVFSKLFISYDENHDFYLEKTYILSEYVDQRYTGRKAHDMYLGDNTWRDMMYQAVIKYIKPTPFLTSRLIQARQVFKQIGKRPKIGILRRNELLKCEQHNNSMPVFEQYKLAISQLNLENPVYVFSVDNLEDLGSFKELYKPHIHSLNIRRTQKNTDMEPHFLPGTAADAAAVFMDVHMLAQCDYFIHPVSNMATAALYMNPKLNSVYLY